MAFFSALFRIFVALVTIYIHVVIKTRPEPCLWSNLFHNTLYGLGLVFKGAGLPIGMG